MPKTSVSDFTARSINKHGLFYDYSFVEFRTTKDKVRIICPDHGEFLQAARDHMRGSGCRNCALAKNRLSFEKFVERSIEAHGNRYEYLSKGFDKGRSALIVCAEHGEFWQDKYRHTQGEGCGNCFRKNSRLTVEDFISRAVEVHGEKYDYSRVSFDSSRDKIEILCSEHGLFEMFIYNHLSGNKCPGCRVFGRSRGEEELSCFVESLGFTVVRNDRSILNGKEIDVYVPSLRIGFEFNGDYWHSDEVILKTRGISSEEFDLLKLEEAKKSGVDLYFVKEFDWINNRKIAESRVKTVLFR